jgi:hypothetical protein
MFWGENVSELTKNFAVIPTQQMSYDDKLNAISRLVICLSVIGFLFTLSITYLIVGILTLGGIYFYKKKYKEGFTGKYKTVSFNDMKEEYSPITTTNPLNNILLTDYSDEINRDEAPPAFNPEVTERINKKTKEGISNLYDGLDTKIFSGLGNNFEFDNMMHQFYSMPSTTIPNDQGAFSEFLYGTLSSCKDGDPIACLQKSYRYI